MSVPLQILQMQMKISTSIGPLFLVANSQALKSVFWQPSKVAFMDQNSNKEFESCMNILNETEKQIHQYLSGKRQDFDLPLEPEGTLFQKTVWSEVNKIKYGYTESYQSIAHKMQKKNYSRAVGSANSKNPLCLIVPCHRVISSNGTLGGYSGGLDVKTQLLQLEKTTLN